jgi:hypothetical protein
MPVCSAIVRSCGPMASSWASSSFRNGTALRDRSTSQPPAGENMGHTPLPEAQSPQGVKPARTIKVGANRKRRRPLIMCMGVLSVAALIAATAALAIGFGAAPSPVAENSTPRAETKSVGTIVLRPGVNGCQRRTFNNQTGQISETAMPCQDNVVLDAKGIPIPTGTIRTIDSISKSFK